MAGGEKKVTRDTRSAKYVCKSRPKKRRQSFDPKTQETDGSHVSASAKKWKTQIEYEVPKNGSVRYRKNTDSERIQASEMRAEQNTREARMLRRQRQIASHEASIEEEGCQYGPGIDDSM